MGRRKPVEGLTIDLTGIPEGAEFRLEDIIVHEPEPVKKAKKVKKEKPPSIYIQADNCEYCNRNTVGAYTMFNERITCGLCRAYNENKITKEIYDMMVLENAKPCVFCDAENVRKHYDHVNMFDKYGTICMLISNGCSMEELCVELSKCQVVCVPCHAIITKYELNHKFIWQKIQFNKKLRKGEDVTELRAELSEKYAEFMAPFYVELRERRRGLGLAKGGVSKGCEYYGESGDSLSDCSHESPAEFGEGSCDCAIEGSESS